MQLMHIDEIKTEFKALRLTPTKGDVPDDMHLVCKVLYNVSRPSKGKQAKKEASLIKGMGAWSPWFGAQSMAHRRLARWRVRS